MNRMGMRMERLSKCVTNISTDRRESCEDLRLVRRLGQGNLSSVFLAVYRGTNKPIAVKVTNKKAYKMAATEKEILSSLDHPFLPSLLTHFESDNHTFLAMKYCSGGDMNLLRHKQPKKTFSESTIRFYAAEVVVALEYLHEQGIVYRDLKPENILVQESGHIMLTDFDLSVRLMSEEENQNQSHSFVGTVEYIAPEVLWGKAHSFPVDWWSLGVFLYEMSHGKTPFRGSSRKDTFVNILCKEPTFAFPPSSSSSALHDLIRKLLAKEPSERLGLHQVKAHPFFRGLRWDHLEFVSRPPFVPPLYPQDVVYMDDMPTSDISFRSDASSSEACTTESDDWPEDITNSAFQDF